MDLRWGSRTGRAPSTQSGPLWWVLRLDSCVSHSVDSGSSVACGSPSSSTLSDHVFRTPITPNRRLRRLGNSQREPKIHLPVLLTTKSGVGLSQEQPVKGPLTRHTESEYLLGGPRRSRSRFVVGDQTLPEQCDSIYYVMGGRNLLSLLDRGLDPPRTVEGCRLPVVLA